MTGGPFQAVDNDFAGRVQESLARQRALATMGAELVDVSPGMVEIGFNYHPDLTQQHGFIHAGILSTVLDSACGYAAYSLMPADAGVLTVEFKVNLLSPARGDRFLARGKVTRSGKTISVATGDLYASGKNGEKHVATMTATIMTITNSEGVRG